MEHISKRNLMKLIYKTIVIFYTITQFFRFPEIIKIKNEGKFQNFYYILYILFYYILK